MKMRFLISTLAISISAILLTNSAVSGEARLHAETGKEMKANGNTVIYIDPHADDEVLTFGIPILNDLRAKKNVYVVLMSAGEDSKARDIVNGKCDKESLQSESGVVIGKPIYCRLHKRVHSPKKEQYPYFTRALFGKERVREFFLSLHDFGVPSSHLVHYGLPNDHFKHQAVITIVKQWAMHYPGATFKTMSSLDVHPDHAMLGKVVDELFQQKRIAHKVNYVSIATWFKHPNASMPKVSLQSKKDRRRLLNAIGVYTIWNPKKKEFALGIHSVPGQFEFITNNQVERVAGK